jgi:hypothetical protein
MNLKKILRVAIPVVTGLVFAGISMLITRPTEPVEPGYDVPTEDPDLISTSWVAPEPPVEVVTKSTPKQRQSKEQ